LDAMEGIHEYSKDGSHIRSKKLDTYVATIYPIAKSRLLVTSAYQDAGCKFTILDGETLDEVGSFGKIRDNELSWRHLTGQRNFYRHGGALLFHESLNNEVSVLTADSCSVSMTVDLFGRNAPKSFLESEFDSIFDFFMQADEAGYCMGLPISEIIWQCQSEYEIALTLTSHLADEKLNAKLSEIIGKEHIDSPVIALCSFAE